MPAASTGNANARVSNGDPLPFFIIKRGIALAVAAHLAILAAVISLAARSRLHHGFHYLTNFLSFRSQSFFLVLHAHTGCNVR